MAQSTNDNDVYPAVARSRERDAHGEAAMLLVESLIHGLIDQSVISVSEAIEIVDAAADVQAEIVIDRGDPPALSSSLTMLNSICSSLRQYMPARGAGNGI